MGVTQNANESLHSLVWSMAPKEAYNSAMEVQLSIDIAILVFNVGRRDAVHRLLEAAGLPYPSPASDKTLQTLDGRRVDDSIRKDRDDVKERRKTMRKGRLARVSAFKTVEGTMYSSGMFHSVQTRTAPHCRTCGQPRKGHRRGPCLPEM